MSKERLNQQPKNPSNLTRFERGWATLAELAGPNGPDHALIESLADVTHDFGRYLVEFSFGEIYQRASLDLKSKELVTIAAATALGAVPTLKVHIQAALNIGAGRDEIIDVLLLMLVYAGFPRAINGLLAPKKYLQAWIDQRSRSERSLTPRNRKVRVPRIEKNKARKILHRNIKNSKNLTSFRNNEFT